MANILLNIGKGIEVAAEDVVKWAKDAETVTVKSSPGALAALAVLLVGVEKAATDAAADAANPLGILLSGTTQLSDFLAVWPELKAFGESLGITKL